MSVASHRIEVARVAGAEWAKTSPRNRRRILSRFAKILAEHQDEVVSAIVNDLGKPALDVLGGDVLVTLEHMRYYRRHAHKQLKPRRIARDWLLFRATRFTQLYEPYGVVLIFGPSNYPLQLALVPAITALYAGNAVIAKLSERVPTLAATLRDLIAEANLPNNLLQVVNDGQEIAEAYIDAHPDFLCFTGSSVNGTRVAQRAASQLIPGIFELGGKDAAIVFGDCDLERTVEGILYGAFSNSGQVCVGTKRLFVEQAISDEFMNRLCARVAQLRVETNTEGECDLARLSTEAIASQLSRQVDDAVQRGCRVLTKESNHIGALPVILTGVPDDADILVEECFGPVLCVESFETETEAIEAANNSEFALGGSVWTRDLAKANRVAHHLSSGNIAVNDVIRNIANPAAPFGGNHASGYGRYHGAEGLFAFSRIKTVMINKSRAHSERNWFPLTLKTYHQLRRLIRIRHVGITSFFSCMVLALSFSASRAPAQQAAGHLHIRVILPPQPRGELGYLIFGSSNGFPNNKAKAIRNGFLPTNTPMGDIDLGELPPGRYAVSLYLDENGNHKLDISWIGIPKEPVGASQNPKPRKGPPHFNDSAFDMPIKDFSLEIKMVRP